MDEAKKDVTVTAEEEVTKQEKPVRKTKAKTDELVEVAKEETTETTEAVAEPLTMAQVLPEPEERGPIVTMKKLLEAGAHFGHQTRRWNPKMEPYIYSARSGVHIIDLEKTIVKLEEAYIALKEIVENGGKVLFVGTRNQYKEIVEEEALRSGSFYVNSRWLGGTLTNFKTIQSRIRHLRDLERQEADGAFDLLPKKEAIKLRKEIEKLAKNLTGIKEMRTVPQALFVCDPKIEEIAVKEARILDIPVFGIIDTNNDPDEVDYMIPANDDATRSVKLIVAIMADAIVEAKGNLPLYAYARLIDELEDTFTMESLGDIEVEDKDRPQRQQRRPQRKTTKRRESQSSKSRRVKKDIIEDDEDDDSLDEEVEVAKENESSEE